MSGIPMGNAPVVEETVECKIACCGYYKDGDCLREDAELCCGTKLQARIGELEKELESSRINHIDANKRNMKAQARCARLEGVVGAVRLILTQKHSLRDTIEKIEAALDGDTKPTQLSTSMEDSYQGGEDGDE